MLIVYSSLLYLLRFLPGEFFCLRDHFLFAGEEFFDQCAKNLIQFLRCELSHFFEGVYARVVQSPGYDGTDTSDRLQIILACPVTDGPGLCQL